MVSVSQDVINKIITTVKNSGGEVYEQDGFINFFGVRNNTCDNTFNDSFFMYWKEGTSFKCVMTNAFTTKPGKTCVLGQQCRQKNGVAILKEGWQKDVWVVGTHNGQYKAVVSSGAPKGMAYTRDKSQYDKGPGYEMRISGETYTNCIGLNLHHSKDVVSSSKQVNNWSAGCQVFGVKSDFNEMLTKAEAAKKAGQKAFSYFLINKSVFDSGGTITGSAAYDPNNPQASGQNGDPNSQYANGAAGIGGVGADGSTGPVGVVSATAFGLDVIFGTIFPDDDNNKYIDMPADEIAVTQYTEPVLKVEELNISEKSLATMGVKPERIAYFIPVVFINDFMIPQTNITNFYLDYSAFLPQVMVEFVDMTNELLSTNIPKPGSYVKVLIGGNGDEKYYKPIRQDFVITNVIKSNKTGGDYQNLRNPLKYKITGVLNVPLGLRKMPWSSSKINARQAIFNISNTIGIGFATNYNTNSDVDVMKWINTQNRSYCDFMKDITRHSCFSPYTFFTSFIDQYYVLNYVECRRLLSHNGKKTDMPQMLYSCIMPEMEKNKVKTTDGDAPSGEQRLSYYFLTNSLEFKGWTNYIEEYFELNDGNTVTSDGYRKTLTYADKCGIPNISQKIYKFLISPVDNLKRDSSKNIESLPEKFDKDTYIPLNLRQTTNSSYADNEKIYNDPVSSESVIDMGEVDSSNNFPLYFFATVQNDFQMKNLKKCGLSVRLQNYNPSITRFSRIWVDIYDSHRNSSAQIRKNPMVKDMEESKVKEYLQDKNENIIVYQNECEKDTGHQVYNRSLSGWYVVTDMKISYNTVKDFKGVNNKKLQTQLILNRIDYKPTFKSEYEMAKKAVEKYKKDNAAENLVCGGDIIY